MQRIVLCDDNPQFLQSFAKFVREECERQLTGIFDFEIGPCFDSGEKLLEHLRCNPVDVLLLDIDMPDMNGFEVARVLCRVWPHVKIVFMSAYDNLVYSVFDFHPFAYLRKAHIFEEFPRVLHRILEKSKQAEKRLSLITGDGEKIVDVNSVAWVENQKNYISIHTVHGQEYFCRGTISGFEEQVRGFPFYRIHSGFLINLEYVERLPEKGYVRVAGSSLPVAQRRMQSFKKEYTNFIRRSFGT